MHRQGRMEPLWSTSRTRWTLSSRELLWIFLFWTSLAALGAVNRLLDPRGFGLRGISPTGPILLAFIESWLWAAATPLIFWLSSRLTLDRNVLPRLLLLVVAGMAIAVVMYLLLSVAREEVFETLRRRRFRPFREVGRFRFVPQLLVYFAVVTAGYAREYFLRDRERAAHAARLQAQLAEARLSALRMQINPHFLFNTLHAVSAMVERDPSGVRKMIARLSELLRHTIDRQASDEIPLQQELDFLRRYIEIMEIRFQGRLHVQTDPAPETLQALVPNLVLQPLVENALEHGASRVSSGQVRIETRREGNRLILRVRDNGPGVAGQQLGVGLSNTRARLEQLYGSEASLTLADDPAGGAVTTIALPLRHAQ